MNGEESKYPFRQHVWALGQGTNTIPVGTLVDSRYEVIAPSIWLDRQPEISPKVPEPVPSFALPYLKAYPYQLNLPGVYGICHQASGEAVLLLSNVPVSRYGQLMPAIAKGWSAASAFHQVYWLYQMINLWGPLRDLGVAASLLKKSNIRVESWRVRLIGLSTQPSNPGLADLAAAWESTYLPDAQPSVKKMLTSVCAELRGAEADYQTIKEKVNAQLLQESASETIELQVAGGTSSGPSKARNEDACYPSEAEMRRTGTADLPLLPRLAIVCDGVGGHEGGEVASQMVVRSLQLQLRGLLAEAMEQKQALPPERVVEQIEAAIRVANNLVAVQNDEQGRSDRQRMGTTLAMALVLPQKVETPSGPAEVNELYLTHVGDSRAYWITTEHCQQLTVDDDIAGREVSAGHSFYATAKQRSDANALSQAVGVREYEHLHPHTQRFLFTSSGVLLLCSDGLSDNQQVESSWANYIGLIVKKIVPLNAAVESWIELANQKNGHDNVAVVLMSVDMLGAAGDGAAESGEGQRDETIAGFDGQTPVVTGGAAGGKAASVASPQPPAATDEMTAASRALLYGEENDDDTPLTPEEMAAVQTEESSGRSGGQKLVTVLLSLLVLGVIGVVGWLLWRNLKSTEPAPLIPEPTAVEEPVEADEPVEPLAEPPVDPTAEETAPVENAAPVAEPTEPAVEPVVEPTPVPPAPADEEAAPVEAPTDAPAGGSEG